MINKTLMIQGCTSDAGKSVMVAGLCRMLARRKLSVAPFKPQNMALNSAVTIDGGEIGRAQAVQAQACFLAPHTDMNPILLKPSSDTGAQVIVHGHPIDAMEAKRYHDYKKVAMQAVLESHKRLSQQYHTIIVEGAGSPAEINLRENDIANMGFAEAVDCPVILVADIDRGGVFAHLVGTLDLLSTSEQNRIAGFIINRFRGDIALLQPGLDWLEQKTGKPVLGVIPYLSDFFLDAEDAIAAAQLLDTKADKLKIIVPVLPRISNHTDFDALRMHPNIDLTFISVQQTLPPADVVILPGSKNVISDLHALKSADWQAKLNKHLRYGGKIIGICGGYQMLGRELHDPDKVETTLGSSTGFAYLNTKTTLHPEKQLTQVSAKLIAPQIQAATIHGYEIHCGRTEFLDKQYTPLLNINHDESQIDGAINQDNNVLGSYVHGLFDQPEACNAILAWAGLSSHHAVDLEALREQQLERLADSLEQYLDTSFVNKLTQADNQDY